MSPFSSRLVVNALGIVPGAPVVSLRAGAGTCLAVVNDGAACLSMLADALAGHVAAVAGQVMVDGRDVTGLPAGRRPCAVVGWRDPLFAHMTVAANLAFGLRARGWSRRRWRHGYAPFSRCWGWTGWNTRVPHALNPNRRCVS
ncbi:hypothetical protein RAA17_02140 [Komagataeibacter rhaeticus]|nr:hypothetical protein [Komagataeibacter rhaeticus]